MPGFFSRWLRPTTPEPLRFDLLVWHDNPLGGCTSRFLVPVSAGFDISSIDSVIQDNLDGGLYEQDPAVRSYNDYLAVQGRWSAGNNDRISTLLKRVEDGVIPAIGQHLGWTSPPRIGRVDDGRQLQQLRREHGLTDRWLLGG